jgi:hypothetical protein
MIVCDSMEIQHWKIKVRRCIKILSFTKELDIQVCFYLLTMCIGDAAAAFELVLSEMFIHLSFQCPDSSHMFEHLDRVRNHVFWVWFCHPFLWCGLFEVFVLAFRLQIVHSLFLALQVLLLFFFNWNLPFYSLFPRVQCVVVMFFIVDLTLHCKAHNFGVCRKDVTKDCSNVWMHDFMIRKMLFFFFLLISLISICCFYYNITCCINLSETIAKKRQKGLLFKMIKNVSLQGFFFLISLLKKRRRIEKYKKKNTERER